MPNSAEPSQELLVQATLEPDADGDGWGDETQDRCLGVPGSYEGCPTPATPVAPVALTGLPGAPTPTEAVPNTRIGKVTIQAAKARVIVRFTATVAGSKFRCKLDKKRWKKCKSPRVFKNLKEGRHLFKVKAIGPTAVPDPTPAKRSFRVEL